MANYNTLKTSIEAVIKQNGNNEITGPILQQTLLAMVNSLGANYQYAGIATPATNPGTPDQNVFYLASTAGTYTNFGGLVLDDGEIAILKYNGAWSKDSTGAASLEKVNQLGQKTVKSNPGKNKLDPEQIVAGFGVKETTGDLVENSSVSATGFIPVNANGLYFNKGWAGGANLGGAVYDTNKQYLRAITQSTPKQYTYQSGDGYVRFTFLTANLSGAQVEVGTQATSYEEYDPIGGYIKPSVAEADAIKNAIILNEGTTTIGRNIYPITGLTLKQGHKYQVVVSSDSTYTPGDELNLKVVSGSSDSTVIKIKDFNGVQIGPTPVVSTLEWKNATVNNYRIGWYGAINSIFVTVSIIDCTINIVTDEVNDLTIPNIASGTIIYGSKSFNTVLSFKKNFKYRIYLWAESSLILSGLTEFNIKNSGGTTQKNIVIPRNSELGPNDRLNFDFVWENADLADAYVAIWSNTAYATTVLVSFQNLGYNVVEIDPIKSIEGDYKNADLVFSSRKKFLTESEQSALGLTPSIHYNNSNDAFQIVHITDAHADAERVRRAVVFSNAIGASLVNSGDFVLNHGEESITWFTDILAKVSGDYVHCLGNHESWGISTNQGLKDKFITPFASEYGWTAPASPVDATFFYKDDSRHKVRYIVLNQWAKIEDGSEYIGPFCTQDQVDFLISTLLSVPSGYGVIVVLHAPDRVIEMSAGYTKFYQKKHYNPTMGLDYINPFSTIIDAWQSKTSLVTTMASSYETISINADFSGVTEAEFIAYICGHTHEDGICFLPNTTNRQLVLCNTLTSAKVNTSGNELAETSDLARVEGTQTQDAFNVYTICRDIKAVKVVKIGSDLPFDFGEVRNYMIIPYAD